MTTDPKTDGYIYAAIPKGPRASAAKAAKAQVTKTVKSAIQEYLERYLSPTGIYREQLKLTADFTVQYETRLSAPEEDDPTIYDLQLARYWQELRQRLPCILIIDVGFNYMNPGLGGMAGSTVLGRSTSAVVMKMDCSLPIKLSVAAQDETMCHDIRDMLVYIFGTLTNLNQAYLIRSRRPEDTWEVRLPFNFEPDGLENRKVTEDNKDSIWTTGITITPEFEGTILIGFEKQVQAELYQINTPDENSFPGGAFNALGQLITVEGAPKTEIIVPEVIYLNNPTTIAAPYMPAEAYFASDNPRIALIEDYKILPKRPGTFNLYLVNKITGDVIQSWEVEVKIQ